MCNRMHTSGRSDVIQNSLKFRALVGCRNETEHYEMGHVLHSIEKEIECDLVEKRAIFITLNEEHTNVQTVITI